jgi:hypothetical protein
MSAGDTFKWSIMWKVRRYDADATSWLCRRLGREALGEDFAAAGIRPYVESEVAGNLLTTVGLNRLTNLLIAGGAQALTNTSARVGVGDGTGTAAIGDTDLSAAAGSTHRWFHVLDASFPTQSNGLVTCQASFGGTDGNFAWNEFGIDIGTPTVTSGSTVNALLLNHKTSIAQGTKTSGQTWVASATITFS